MQTENQCLGETPRTMPAAAMAATWLAEEAGRDRRGQWRRLRQELRQAVQSDGFNLVFQPRRRLRDGVLLGAQAQLRWPRRRGGMTQASAVLPLLEQCGLANGVAGWALTAACQAAALWPRGQVSVAAAASSLRDGSLLAQVGHALTQSGLAPERLELELGEAVLAAEGDETLLALSALRDAGVGVALEAFGSDTAGLLTLKRLPLTALKLDRSLVRDLPLDREAAAIVQAVTEYAHALDMSVAAMAMETAAQRDFLRRTGCDEAQGSLCGKPEGPEIVAQMFTE